MQSEFMKVTVGVPTYNHGLYIRQSLQSIVDQVQDGFEMEVLIFDDCSTDNTPEICREFEQKFPFVKFRPSERNLGVAGNGPRLLANCQGDLLAFCDGDDYWTDKRKLARQVSIFKTEKNIAAVYHNVEIVKEGQFVKNIYTEGHLKILKFDDLMEGHFMKTSALVFRYRPNMFEPILSGKLPGDDTSICFLALENGGIGYYIDEVMAAYRVHDHGVWSNIDEQKKLEWSLRSQKQYLKYYLGKRDVTSLKRALSKSQVKMFMLNAKRFNIRGMASATYDIIKAKMGKLG